MFSKQAVLRISSNGVYQRCGASGTHRLAAFTVPHQPVRPSFRRCAAENEPIGKPEDPEIEGTPQSDVATSKSSGNSIPKSTTQIPTEDPIIQINPEPVIDAVATAAETVAEAVVGAGVQVSQSVTSEAVVTSSSNELHATAAPPEPEPKPAAAEAADVDELKLQLLAAVASLDRGIAANVREAREVDEVARKLEAAGGKVTLDWKTQSESPDTSTMEILAGTWRLIYSSGFNRGGLGGTRPGPPAAFVPLVLGQVYQRIDNAQGKLDNIVEFLFSYGLPPLPFLSSEPESPAVRLTLGHDFTVLGSNTVEITYEDTAAELLGTQFLDSLPKLAVPQVPEFLRPPKFLRSATFDVSYLDGGLRVTRGDRGELRIYLKDEDLAPAGAPADYVD